MIGERDFEIKRGGPEFVILWRRIAFAAGITFELYAFEAELGAALQFFDRIINPGDRNRTYTDQTVGSGSHILLGKELIVSAHQLAVKIVLLSLPQHR